MIFTVKDTGETLSLRRGDYTGENVSICPYLQCERTPKREVVIYDDHNNLVFDRVSCKRHETLALRGVAMRVDGLREFGEEAWQWNYRGEGIL